MSKTNTYIYLIPLLPLIGAFLNLCVWRIFWATSGRLRQPNWLTHGTAVLSVLASFVVTVLLVAGPLWAAYKGWKTAGAEGILGGLHQKVWTWIDVGGLSIDLAFRIDTLTAVMLLVITGIGTLIHIYSIGYMADEKRYPAYFGYLNLFTGSMLILVLADNLPVMFIGWEGVGLCSYLLIGFYFEQTANANAGRKAFVVNRIGDFAFLIGMFLLFWATSDVMTAGAQNLGPLDFQWLQQPEVSEALKETIWGERVAMWAGVFLFIGACGKSAQLPLYIWLPDAMAGPTPVSALIHAATMVTAGIYMIARTSFLYAHSTTAMAVVAGIGALTALFAAIMAFAQTDLKKVLAYSTVSQLGFMFVGVGVGAYAAGIFHLMTHAFFKAGLFLAAGSVMHAMSGSGDITKMGGLRKKLPYTHFSFIIYCLAIAGIFPFAGFFSKDEILAGAFGADVPSWAPIYGKFIWGVLTVAALGTAFYMFRLYFLVFGGSETRCDAETQAHIHESPATMTAPLVILAGFTVVVGFLGMPHLSFIGDWGHFLPSWLDASLVSFDRPSLEASIMPTHLGTGATLGLIGIAFFGALAMIFVARALYGQGPSSVVERLTATPAGQKVHKVVYNKFYVDEAYELVILKPFRWIAQALFEVVDRFIIDLLIVNGSAWVVDSAGRVMRWFQNGQVQRYLVAIVVGAAVIFWITRKPDLDFEVEQSGPSTLVFTPDVGGGSGAKGAKVSFDFDLDGEPDRVIDSYNPSEPWTTEWSFGGPGKYKVSMTMTDAVSKKTYTMTKTVEIKGPPAAEGQGSEGEQR